MKIAWEKLKIPITSVQIEIAKRYWYQKMLMKKAETVKNALYVPNGAAM